MLIMSQLSIKFDSSLDYILKYGEGILHFRKLSSKKVKKNTLLLLPEDLKFSFLELLFM